MSTTEDLKSGAVGIIIGRFQVPLLHSGHLGLLNHVCNLHKDVLIVVGSTTAKGTTKDPMDFETRKSLFDSFISSKVHSNGWMKVVNHMDQGSDLIWSQNLDALVAANFPGRDAILYGGRDSFIPHYSGTFPTEMVPNVDSSEGTILRVAASKMPVANEDFRKGVIYSAYSQWPRVHSTVDIGIVRREETGWKILLGHKWKGDRHRLIGGFADPSDTSFEAAAVREAKEETGLDLKEVEYVTSSRQGDFRYKSDRDRIITTFFMADVTGSEQVPVAGDDIVELDWYPLNYALAKDVHPSHEELVSQLRKRLQWR